LLTYYDHADRNESKIALTFDDGPNPTHTIELLDILNQNKIKATFFLLGKWIEMYPNIVKNIFERGHLIGNHGYSHSKLNENFEKTQQLLKEITGDAPKYLRPPYGDLIYPGLRKLENKIKIIRWDVSASDWKQPGEDFIIDSILKNTKNGSIILLHDGDHKDSKSGRCAQMLKVLPEIIKELKKQYMLVRLDEMKLIPSNLPV